MNERVQIGLDNEEIAKCNGVGCINARTLAVRLGLGKDYVGEENGQVQFQPKSCGTFLRFRYCPRKLTEMPESIKKIVETI
jgi:hypothetical protein